MVEGCVRARSARQGLLGYTIIICTVRRERGAGHFRRFSVYYHGYGTGGGDGRRGKKKNINVLSCMYTHFRRADLSSDGQCG